MLEHTLPDGDAHYPDLAAIFPAANRMQRAAFDLIGIASDGDDQRPWVWQASWPIDRFRCAAISRRRRSGNRARRNTRSCRVEGDGVHEIPVGPVHAGIIEPGHFRFQVVGEKVLRLEERLGLRPQGHREALRSAGRSLDGHRLAGRVSGDSTVAYAWAYAQALEADRRHATMPPRAAWLRALALERERIANHLGDLGYLGNDGGFAFGLAQFSRLKEDVLRTERIALSATASLMDYVVPGGVAHDLAPDHAATDPRRVRRDSSARSPCCATSTTSMPACRTGSAAAAS